MKKIVVTILSIFLFSTISNAQKFENYSKLWLKVQQFEVKSLPKSALKVVETIYEKAKKEENSPQILKSLLYKSKFALTLEEDAQLKVIDEFKNEIKQTKTPTSNLLESVLANLYWQYFQQNRWKFYNRTKTSKKVDTMDFRTWDLETLFSEIHTHFQNSLKNGIILQQTNLEQYNNILHLQKNSKKYRPTLFDFIAHNALDFYKTNESSITKPSYKFEVKKQDFERLYELKKDIYSSKKDSFSLQLNALKIYQRLIAFHNKTENSNAFVSVELERLKFVKQYANFEEKNTVYFKILTALKEEFKTHEASTLVDFEIARIYNNEALQYNAENNVKHQFKNAEALKICNAALKKFPESLGSKKCKSLKNNILHLALTITSEKHIPTNLHSKFLVKYKNIDKLFTSIYTISESDIRLFNKIHNNAKKVNFIKNLEQVNTFYKQLKNEKDYQQHSTEIVIPPLKNGYYLIVSSVNKKLNKESVFATATIQSTNISIVQKSISKQHNFQVINRNTGKPFKNASISVKNYNVGRYNKSISLKLSTNEMGEFSFKTHRYHRNVVISVKTENEKASFGGYYLNENRKPRVNKNTETTIKPFIFTDRSIYRPGQTVHFKAIFLKKQGDKTTVLTDEFVEFILENPNGEEVKQLDLKLNEFGSTSGTFILPNNGLNGEYTIYVNESSKYDSKFYDNGNYDFLSTEKRISVEEYKRPKFETEFKPITDTFKVNDSVTVKGIATAFAGSSISGAKVTYRVHRKVVYPRWYYWYRPSFNASEAMEITHGETTTDSEGNFNITFKAIPDKSVNKDDKPVFNYEIEADVTDINGETRSATTLVKVGYHTLEISATIAAQIDVVEKNHKISLKTNNLNGEFVPTKGKLKIYKLQAPQNVLRKRPWNVPDYQEISKDEYQKLFPYEPYTNDENNINHWKKGTLVFEANFDTKKSKEIVLKKIKKWIDGKYIIEVEANDKFNQKIEDKVRFSVFNSKKPKIADKQLFEISTDKLSYKPNETINLKIGSASNKIFVTVAVEKNYNIVNQLVIQLNNEVKTIKIPVTDKDLGGFAVKYSYSNYNEFKSGVVQIYVPHSINNLEIETQTFRDKLQPGQEETWSFNIKGKNTDKVTAEILASMYDASLDEFKPHSWSFNPIQHTNYYAYNSWNSRNSYGNTNFRVYNLSRRSRRYYGNIRQNFDKLNWFGFSLNNSRYLKKRYMDKAKAAVEQKASQRSSFDKTISGVVTDEEGLPLPGVTVVIKGTSFGAQTDFDGAYSIKVKNGDELTYSYIGFNSIGKVVGKSSTMDITLEASNEALNEVVVVGFGTQRKSKVVGAVETALEGRVAGLVSATEMDEDSAAGLGIKRNPKELNDTVNNTSKKNASISLTNVKARKNFKETAFFFPHLKTDKNGNVNFSFTMPEALTRWKLQLLAHTKELATATKTLTTVTQKELMVLPNPPRFLREGDVLQFSSKISNLSDKALNGVAQLVLTDAISGKDITNKLVVERSRNDIATSTSLSNQQNFIVDAKGNTNVNWTLAIPENVQAVQYKIVAKAGEFSDGEQNVLPVLSNRMLVTETLPMWVRSNQTKTFKLDKLLNIASTTLSDRTLKNKTSTTLSHHKLTLEITSNPAWYAIQSLPYLMEYPYECAEQTFARYYANTLASYIANSNPKIQEVFNLWKTNDALISNLEKNEELKSIIIQETPWLRDAQSETEQKKRIGLLFDLNKMKNEQEIAINKLKQLQFSNGGFPWFKGSNYPNRYITQHIASSYGHLKQLGVLSTSVRSLSEVEMTDEDTNKMFTKAVNFLDDEILEDYTKLLNRAKKIREKAKTKAKGIKAEKKYLENNHLGHTQLHYLYMRSFYKELKIPSKVKKAVDYYTKQSATYWTDFNLYSKGMIALIQHRNNNSKITSEILKSLKENSITSEELGMYWKENTASWYWYQAPIETQALLIEVFSEIENDIATVDELKVWLLKNKQTNRWKTTKATTEAVYALLLQGSNWLAASTERSRSVNKSVEVTVGNKKIDPSKLENVKVEAGTGYFKTSWNGNEITPKMGEVTISKKDDGIAWGGLYWQYFEDLDKITSAETPLKLSKKLFIKQNTDTGKELTKITENSNLKLGDLITVRIELKVDRPMEFVHMKDMRASGLEPINVLSSYKWQDGLGYYESTKDASTNFFMERLPKGIYVFEYDLRVNNAGIFSNGITTIQSMYAPEFSSHSEGVKIYVNE